MFEPWPLLSVLMFTFLLFSFLAVSEPGRNGRGHKVKVARLSPTRLSPIQPRKNDLSKTLSVGASLGGGVRGEGGERREDV